jgi:hypothetical protein
MNYCASGNYVFIKSPILRVPEILDFETPYRNVMSVKVISVNMALNWILNNNSNLVSNSFDNSLDNDLDTELFNEFSNEEKYDI